jgi:hypothetical protein
VRIVHWSLFTAAIALSAIHPAFPATIHVPTDIGTIQAAIDSATHGDEIVVATGTYFERIHFHGKNIVLRSTEPANPDVVAATIIDANASRYDDSPVVTFDGSETRECAIDGFTIANGYNRNGGGGIDGNQTHATIRHNTITNNTTTDRGGGGVFNAWGLIEHNVICSNDSSSGGGLAFCDGTIQNNVILSNSACDDGGGLAACDGIIQNNLICRNTTKGAGGGIRDYQGGIIQNNTIFGNSAGYGGGIFAYQETVIIRNNIIWGNIADSPPTQLGDFPTPEFCCIQDWIGDGTGNITVYPLFTNPEIDDFHLLPSSFCIDSGSFVQGLPSDFDDEPRGPNGTSGSRGDGSGFDIGADEYVGTVPVNLPPFEPNNHAPQEGETGVSLSPTLSCSLFEDPNSLDRHAASHWQIDDDLDFESPEFDSGIDTAQLTECAAYRAALLLETTYYWRVRHMDSAYSWGRWSQPTRFQTLNEDWILVPDDYPTIQAAIDSAAAGDTIVARPGHYFEHLDFHGKDIVLSSVSPRNPAAVADTVLSSSFAGPVVSFSGNESKKCVLSGFTITDGSHPSGGGVHGNGTKATIRYNSIIGNHGSGINGCDGLIQGNGVYSNQSAGDGGGLASCHGHISGNRIMGNHAENGGGLANCHGTITNNVVAWNVSYPVYRWVWVCCPPTYPSVTPPSCYYIPKYVHGGHGSALCDCWGNVINNTIVDNTYWDNIPPYPGKSIVSMQSTDFVASHLFRCYGNIENCVIYSTYVSLIPPSTTLRECASPSYCCIDESAAGTGNVTGGPNVMDPVKGDFRLNPDSICIDSGRFSESRVDFDGTPRGFDAISLARGDGSDFDIGAFEYQGPFMFSADLNNSKSVDPLDLLVFQQDWHRVTSPPPPADTNGDEDIDALDLLVLLRDWHRETGPQAP